MNKRERILNEIQQLYEQARQIDKANLSFSEQRIAFVSFFDNALFKTNSTKLIDYVSEMEDTYRTLDALADDARRQRQYLGEQFSNQLTALIKLVQHYELKYRQLKQPKTPRKKAAKGRQIAQRIMGSSHDLYRQLSEYHEFERRLNDMVFERLQQSKEARPEQQHQLSREVSALQQRLKRCRNAIRQTEENIDMLERKTSRRRY